MAETTVRVADAVVRLPNGYAGRPLDPADALLAEAAGLHPAERVLILGAGTGVLAVVAGQRTGLPVVVADHSATDLAAAQVVLDVNNVAAHIRTTRDLAQIAAASFDVALINIAFQPNSARLVELLADVRRLVRVGGRVLVAGGRNRGVDSAIKRLGAIFGAASVIAYRQGCRVGQAVRQPDAYETAVPVAAPDLVTVDLRGSRYTLEVDPGVFARGLLDPATALLIDALLLAPHDHVLDLGCGSGILGMAAARLAPQGHVWLVDTNYEAVALTQRNLVRNAITNATVLVSDSTAAVADRQFDVVVSNPPFHQGRREDKSLGPRFINDAARVLRNGGRCYLVANRFLPYETVMRAMLRNVREVAGDGRFKVLCGEK